MQIAPGTPLRLCQISFRQIRLVEKAISDEVIVAVFGRFLWDLLTEMAFRMKMPRLIASRRMLDLCRPPTRSMRSRRLFFVEYSSEDPEQANHSRHAAAYLGRLCSLTNLP